MGCECDRNALCYFPYSGLSVLVEVSNREYLSAISTDPLIVTFENFVRVWQTDHWAIFV